MLNAHEINIILLNLPPSFSYPSLLKIKDTYMRILSNPTFKPEKQDRLLGTYYMIL